MSLISDALQKAGTKPQERSALPPSQRSPWGFRILLLGLMLATFAGLTLLVRNQRSSETSSANAAGTVLPPTGSARLPFLAEKPPVLQGILQETGGKPLAIIGDRLVEEGGMIGGSKLTRIGSGEVELEKEGRTKTLKLN